MITIGFSSHHVEALPYMREQMERHQVVILEEPTSSRFGEMLNGSLPVSDYILELDSGFPEFDRQLCILLRHLHCRGQRVIQVEPYLARLLQVHELFAMGKTPDDVVRRPELKEVYLAEKHATGALISFYAKSTSAPFEEVVEAVKTFARADASRLAFRERLRAKAIASLVNPAESMYVESGYIHYPLYRYLCKEIGGSENVRVVFLLARVVKKLGGKRRNMGPGDVLTLHYALHNKLTDAVANRLAARSLIYIKLIQKEELLPGASEAPHAEDEVKVNRLVDRLNFKQCGEIFKKIRLLKREDALRLAEGYGMELSG